MFGQTFIKEKRAELRFPIALPLSYVMLGSEETTNGETHDISRQGLCLAADREIPLGTQMEIILKMIDSDEMIHKKGMVIWSLRYGDDLHRIGIKLQESKLKPVPLVLRTIMALAQAHRQKKPA